MKTEVKKTRANQRRTLRDRLSRLTFLEACRLLGPTGKSLIQKSANLWDIKIEDDVHLGDDLFRLRIPEAADDGSPIVVTITTMALARDRLHWNCTHCETACACRGRVFADLGGKNGAPAGNGLSRARTGGQPRRRRARGPGDRRSPPTIQKRVDARHGNRSRPALDRLCGHEPRKRQELSRRLARTRSRRVVLLVSRFSGEHAGSLQTCAARDRPRQAPLYAAATQGAA